MQPWQCAALAPGAKSYKRCICTTTASPPFLAAWRRALSFHTVQGVQDCFQVLRRMCHPSRCSEGAWRTCRSWPWSGLGNKSHESHENTSARYSLLVTRYTTPPLPRVIKGSEWQASLQLNAIGFATGVPRCKMHNSNWRTADSTVYLPAHHHQAPRPLPRQEGWSSHLH